MQIFAGQFCKLLNLKLPRMIKIWTVCGSSRTKEFYIQQHLESFSLSAIWDEEIVKNPYSIWKSYKSKWSFWWERWCWLPWAMNTWTWCICLFSNPAIKSVPMQQNVKFHAYPLSGHGHIHRHTCLRIIRQSFTVVLLSSKIFASDSESSGNLLNVALLEPLGAYEPLWKPVSIPMWRCLASPKSINGSLGGSLRICFDGSEIHIDILQATSSKKKHCSKFYQPLKTLQAAVPRLADLKDITCISPSIAIFWSFNPSIPFRDGFGSLSPWQASFGTKRIYTWCPEGLEGGYGGDKGCNRTSCIHQLNDVETTKVRSTTVVSQTNPHFACWTSLPNLCFLGSLPIGSDYWIWLAELPIVRLIMAWAKRTASRELSSAEELSWWCG